MPAETMFQNFGATVTFDADTGVVRLQATRCPTPDEIDHVWTVVGTFSTHHPTPCLLHMTHQEEDDMDPPDLKTMLHLAARVMRDFRELNFRKILIQPKVVDQRVADAHNVFRGLMPQSLPLKITSDPDEVARVLAKFCR